MREKMDSFEAETRQMIRKLSTYSLVEFYHEKDHLEEKIKKLNALSIRDLPCQYLV